MSPAWLGFAVFSPTTKLQQLIVSVLTRHCIPVFDVTERATCVSVGLFQPGLEGGGEVWVAVCLTTRQTVMKDGRHSRKKGGAAAIRVWKDLTGTFSGRCKNNPIRTLPEPQRPADLLTSDGPWFGLLSKWAEFSSLEPDCRVFLRTNWLNHPINSVICKKKKTERQEGAGGGCGKQPRALTGSHYSDLCVNSAPRLLKHCHPAISSVYLHNTTQRLTARLPTDSSCSTERPNNLRQNLSESSVIRIQTYSN